ncbi:SCO family protein [Aquariibacter albus]|uniref:Cytochrome C oxidase subunit I n=1 Tax=Aquariibacter albus TaxID=2759899 RepID=A0A839HKU4_9BURK|nr:hypothetical protein [Aquariibacter albus]MBB1162753.1 hypothetical protein [Aquariibacter albus]
MSGSRSSDPAAVESLRPDEPLSFAVHTLNVPQAEAVRARSGRLKMLAVLLVCAAPVIASYFTYYVIRPDGRMNTGELIDPQRPIPPATQLPLTRLDGQPVAPESLRQQWLLIVVGGGACDARCERQLYLQRQLRETLGREKDRVDRVWLIDDAEPAREVLLPALEGAQVLRAPAEALKAWLPAADGQSPRAHFFLVDPLGNLMLRFPVDADPSKVKRDLERLLRASSSWDRAGR